MTFFVPSTFNGDRFSTSDIYRAVTQHVEPHRSLHVSDAAKREVKFWKEIYNIPLKLTIFFLSQLSDFGLFINLVFWQITKLCKVMPLHELRAPTIRSLKIFCQSGCWEVHLNDSFLIMPLVTKAPIFLKLSTISLTYRARQCFS